MFVKYDETNLLTPIDGIKMKTLCYGDKTLLSRFHLKKGAVLPKHSHPHEQAGCLISGKMTLFIDGKPCQAEPGDTWTIKGDVAHWAEVIEDSVAIEVFSPVREDYLPK